LSATPEPAVLMKRVAQDAAVYEIRFYANPNVTEPDIANAIMLRHIHGAINRFQLPNPVPQLEISQPLDFKVHRDEAEIRRILHGIPLFQNTLNDNQLTTLSRHCAQRIIPEKATFIHQGDAASSMFVIVEGVARVFVADGKGGSHQVAILTEGDIVGEMSLLTGAPRTASVVTELPLCALEITKEQIGSLLHETPQLLERFSHILAERQQKLNEIANRQASLAQTESDLLARMSRFFAQFF
jgi:CRP-like cAMP-binding protein